MHRRWMATKISKKMSCLWGINNNHYKYLHKLAGYHYFNGTRSIGDSSIITTNPRRPLSPSQHQQPPRRKLPTTTPNHLPKPFIIYQDNHLLVLYKPPGWHSIPNQSKSTPSQTATTTNNTTTASKCLLTYCQSQKYGGGSQHEYIKPIHRIDQPCSGMIMYGKTTKVASRIQTAFSNMSRSSQQQIHATRRSDCDPGNDHHHTTNLEHSDESKPPQPSRPSNKKHDFENATNMIQKIYYVMVRVHHHYDINNTIGGTWHTLRGIMLSKSNHIAPHPQNPPPPQQQSHTNNHNNKGWSVQMIPTPTPPYVTSSSNQKLCALQYRIVQTYPIQNNHANVRLLLQVRTEQGTRHLIRAMLACYQMTVVGDVRYGSDHNDVVPLPDQSVALHAYSIRLKRDVVDKTKTKRRHDMEPAETTNNNQHGHTDNNDDDDDNNYYYWKASIPNTWDEYFGCTQAMIDQWEDQYPTKML